MSEVGRDGVPGVTEGDPRLGPGQGTWILTLVPLLSWPGPWPGCEGPWFGVLAFGFWVQEVGGCSQSHHPNTTNCPCPPPHTHTQSPRFTPRTSVSYLPLQSSVTQPPPRQYHTHTSSSRHLNAYYLPSHSLALYANLTFVPVWSPGPPHL